MHKCYRCNQDKEDSHLTLELLIYRDVVLKFKKPKYLCKQCRIDIRHETHAVLEEPAK